MKIVQILKLRAEGKTYKEICKELGCSKSTVSYHCNPKVKQSSLQRSKDNPNTQLCKRINSFKVEDIKFSNLRTKCNGFNRDHVDNHIFGYKTIIEKFGKITSCYLTGRTIDLYKDDYQFDHIIPASKGGSSKLDNLGITCPEANIAKGTLSVSEFLSLCKEVLEYHDYIVTNR